MKPDKTVDNEFSAPLLDSLSTNISNSDKILELLPVAVYTCDTEGRITFFNKAAADLWGRSPEIGKDLWCGSWKIYKPDGSPLSLDSCPMAVTLKEARPVTGEEILVARIDGSIRKVAPNPQPIFDEKGKMVGAVNMLVDITDLKTSQHALAESETKYRELASTLQSRIEENTRELKRRSEELLESEARYHRMVAEVEDYAIILLDQNGIIQNWNKGAEKIKGYKEEEIVGKSFLNFYLSEDRRNGLPIQILNEAREKGKALHEGWRLRNDGTTFWGSIVLTALHDKQNNVIGFSKVTRDLTERKMAEDRMKEYSNKLEFQNKELEQFAYAASHDMKEPLRKIHLYNCAIAENPANQLDERSADYLKRSIKAVRRMTELIEDLLTYSKTTVSMEGYHEVDLGEVIEEFAQLYEDADGHQKARIEYDALPTVWGVPFQFKQLMDNLISNAVKYKHPDRDLVIKISSQMINGIELNEKEADVNKKYHKISVTDNGVGFDTSHADKIFDIFQRLNNLPGVIGSGIGLAICKRIVRNHNGFIRASGKSNEGARFDFFIPTEQ
jgi:PAS domain S-box-containing protein